ncbi:hypothetical protein MKW98_003108 [Papaver atlanticum]|uniref:Uncharacterized protein n=1 Tax=Papaver atlanticum TaxID=357466 RepID=A0AAD4THP6_9MAGN|nr:hypothetical protein MKW98_003108 [Papaver atlanticum]
MSKILSLIYSRLLTSSLAASARDCLLLRWKQLQSPTVRPQLSSLKLQKMLTLLELMGIIGRLRGPDSAQCATGSGELVQVYSAVSYLDWKRNPKILKEDVWNVLLKWE